MYNLQFATPLAFAFGAASDDYCGTVVPHFPFPRGGFNPGNVLPQGGQQGIIIVGG